MTVLTLKYPDKDGFNFSNQRKVKAVYIHTVKHNIISLRIFSPLMLISDTPNSMTINYNNA